MPEETKVTRPEGKPLLLSVPGVMVALVMEVKMKGEEDLVKVRVAVTVAIDNLLEEVATTPCFKDRVGESLSALRRRRRDTPSLQVLMKLDWKPAIRMGLKEYTLFRS